MRVFASNLRDLLLAAPAGARVTMGLDPGFRSGVKVAVVDATGKVVTTTTIYPHEPARRWDEALATLGKLARKHRVDLIAIGNGTASRETDKLATDLVKLLPDLKMSKIVVSEAGASVYSASAFASEELPDLDVTMRGAVSIARRLQDPLAELVKIDPKAIGVGQYQHDLSESKLARSLDAVVEDCVNAVGVDANTASAPLLARVSGIGSGLAQSIVQHRDANGPFKSRKALKEVPRLGPKAFEQCAGFLRITGGEDPLDASGVHPESYPVVRKILAATKSDIKALIGNAEILRQVRPQNFVDDTFGLPTVTDILRELEKPGRDPRPAFKAAVFKEGVETLKDLKRGMILEGTVTNVAAFGAFVDIGVHQDGLVHISAMSKTFIKDPREVVKSGDIVKVKVLEVEVARKRIALTLASRRRGRGKERASGARQAARHSARRDDIVGAAQAEGGDGRRRGARRSFAARRREGRQAEDLKGLRLFVETDEHRGLVNRLSFGHDRICGEAFIGPAQRDAFHDDLIVGYSGVLAHDRRLHDALAVDHGAQPARPGGVDQCGRHGAAIEGRIVAAVQRTIICHDHAYRRVELTEAAQHPVLALVLVVARDPHGGE